MRKKIQRLTIQERVNLEIAKEEKRESRKYRKLDLLKTHYEKSKKNYEEFKAINTLDTDQLAKDVERLNTMVEE